MSITKLTIPDEATIEWISDHADPFDFYTYSQWLDYLGVKFGFDYVYSRGFRSIMREFWSETKGLERKEQGLAPFGNKLE